MLTNNPNSSPLQLSTEEPAGPATIKRSHALTVTELNRAARDTLELGIGSVAVTGELSNVVKATSGHWYFTLKDVDAQVKCTFFRQAAMRARLVPTNGLKVEVWAKVSLYEARGDFQLNIEAIKLAGEGDRYAAFLRLKAKLEFEGLLNSERKRALPRFPKAIGVITSLTGAALQDVLTTLERRAPMIPVLIFPTTVQGDNAPSDIVSALESAQKRSAECDVLIVCRGGGSTEDLWAFNDEAVARAIAHMSMPVVCGVGHETDFTIADFVADSRAATPTAAAVAATPNRDDLAKNVNDTFGSLQRAMNRRFEAVNQHADQLAQRLQTPNSRIAIARSRLNELGQKNKSALNHRVFQQHRMLDHLNQRFANRAPRSSEIMSRLDRLQARLNSATHTLLRETKQRLSGQSIQLELLSPLAVLKRGYTLTLDEQGNVVKMAATAAKTNPLRIKFADGDVMVTPSASVKK